MAYLPFPSTWPLFTAKDKIGDWFEAYASLLELNVWMNTRIDSAEYNDETGEWTVQVERGGEPKRKLKPHHVIMCTGLTRAISRFVLVPLTDLPNKVILVNLKYRPFLARTTSRAQSTTAANIKTLPFPVM